MNREAIAALRRALKPPTKEEVLARQWEDEKQIRAWWLREHPGRTRAEYDRLMRDETSEVWEWRKVKGAAWIEAERQAFEADHPGQQYPEHECGLTDREYTDLERWRRKRARRVVTSNRNGCAP
jgi:hypothetical protein